MKATVGCDADFPRSDGTGGESDCNSLSERGVLYVSPVAGRGVWAGAVLIAISIQTQAKTICRSRFMVER